MFRFQPSGVATAVALLAALCAQHAMAQSEAAQAGAQPAESAEALPTVTVRASADASAQGLSPAYAGGQVARGGRAGILGTRDNMDTPFSITAYTNELIQDKQARSVGEVLINDPSVRLARGYGNYQEAYYIRGFTLSSDDVAYNGLYGLLPRQYIASELMERVEVLRGASTFLNGVSPGGGGLGGSINLLPKRAAEEPLNRVTLGVSSEGLGTLSADVSRRFGPDQSTGVRFNAVVRDGGTGVDDENNNLGVAAVGIDWRSRDVRLSADLGYQDNKLKEARPSVTLGAVTSVPSAPDNTVNFAQPWSYSNERDLFGTFRGEFDVRPDVTAWLAFGARRTDEANSLANLTVNNATTGAGTTYRFDNTRADSIQTGEVGVRGKLRTGTVGHEWVLSAGTFKQETDNAYVMDSGNLLATNLFNPVDYVNAPAYSSGAWVGNTLADPRLNTRTTLTSFTVADTLSMLNDDLLLTVGVRHQRIKVENFAYNTLTPETPYEVSRNSPSAAVVYKFTPKLAGYANYIEGLSKGDTAPSTSSTPGRSLAPFVSRQKEIGLKYDMGRLAVSAAVFSTEKPRGALRFASYTYDGNDEHKGLEINIQGVAQPGLRVLGGVTFLDAKQKDTGSAATEGQRVIGVPKAQSTLGAEWDVPGVRGLTLDGRLIYTGASYADEANTLKVPSWTRLDVGARYITDIAGSTWTFRARIDNLADRDYWASVGGYPGNGYLVLGNPRTLGLSASVDF
ncbi:MAG: TonB-dependent siderophore receptor [Aquabacterium sp.]|jgi:iron complex outermembrane recepter protein|uniref:TonB-dependent receptor n=1 Tax=Aquabacterium sp. TaxID=1872578 RepID=UPI003BAE28AD